MWSYVRQFNHFFRIEEKIDDAKKPRVVCVVQNAADARLICHCVNKSGLKPDDFVDKKDGEKNASSERVSEKSKTPGTDSGVSPSPGR